MEKVSPANESRAQQNPSVFFQNNSQISSGAPGFSVNNTPGPVPRLDIIDTGAKVVYVFEIPGVDPDSMVLEVSEREVVLQGKTSTPAGNGANYIYQERAAGVYNRLVTPPPNVDVENITADYKNGLLSVEFTKQGPQS